MRFTENEGRNSLEVSSVEITAFGDDGRLAELAEFQRRSNALTMQLEGSNDLDQVNAAVGSFAI